MPTPSRPCADSNAIEAVAFAITLSRVFTPREVESLSTIETLLKDDLPHAVKVSDFLVNVDAGSQQGPAVSFQQQSASGILLQKNSASGRAEWALRAAAETIVVNCWNYTSWDEVWPKAKKYLSSAIAAACVDQQLYAVSLATQVIDKFIYEDSGSSVDYSVDEVFSQDCPYLTPMARNSGKFWHVHQGWFDDAADLRGRVLNVLNISSGEPAPSVLHTTIDHQCVTQFRSPVEISSLLGRDSISDCVLDHMFGIHHSMNRQMITRALNPLKQKQVGLLP